MRLDARSPVLRGRQVLADTGLLLWVLLWVLVARTVHGAVLVLAEPGRAVAAWRSGDPAAVRALAALELRRLGLALPGPSAANGAQASGRGA